MNRRPPRPSRTDTCPYTTLFRSGALLPQVPCAGHIPPLGLKALLRVPEPARRGSWRPARKRRAYITVYAMRVRSGYSRFFNIFFVRNWARTYRCQADWRRAMTNDTVIEQAIAQEIGRAHV